MAVELPSGIRILNAVPVEYYRGPWASLAAAKAAVPLAIRHDGLTVKIIGSGEYWWLSGDLSDSGLVAKTAGGSVTSVAFSGGTTGLTVTGSPITGSGTITLTGTLIPANGGTGLTSLGSANTILAVNTGATGLEYKTVSNGLTSAAGTLKWGGQLSAATVIDQNSQTLTFSNTNTFTVNASAGNFNVTGATTAISTTNFNVTSANTSISASGRALRVSSSGIGIDVTGDATGDTYYRNSSGFLTRVPAGSNGQVFSISGGLPSWQNSSALVSLSNGSGTTAAGSAINLGGTVTLATKIKTQSFDFEFGTDSGLGTIEKSFGIISGFPTLKVNSPNYPNTLMASQPGFNFATAPSGGTFDITPTGNLTGGFNIYFINDALADSQATNITGNSLVHTTAGIGPVVTGSTHIALIVPVNLTLYPYVAYYFTPNTATVASIRASWGLLSPSDLINPTYAPYLTALRQAANIATTAGFTTTYNTYTSTFRDHIFNGTGTVTMNKPLTIASAALISDWNLNMDYGFQISNPTRYGGSSLQVTPLGWSQIIDGSGGTGTLDFFAGSIGTSQSEYHVYSGLTSGGGRIIFQTNEMQFTMIDSVIGYPVFKNNNGYPCQYDSDYGAESAGEQAIPDIAAVRRVAYPQIGGLGVDPIIQSPDSSVDGYVIAWSDGAGTYTLVPQSTPGTGGWTTNGTTNLVGPVLINAGTNTLKFAQDVSGSGAFREEIIIGVDGSNPGIHLRHWSHSGTSQSEFHMSDSDGILLKASGGGGPIVLDASASSSGLVVINGVINTSNLVTNVNQTAILSKNLGSGRTYYNTNVPFKDSANTFTNGKQTFAASTTGYASINIPSGGTPSSPATGDMWYDGTHLYYKTSGGLTDLLAVGGSGITNSALANELMKSNGTNAVSSGIFSSSNGNAIFGSSSLSGDRTLSTDSSSTDSSFIFQTKNSGAYQFLSGTGRTALLVDPNQNSGTELWLQQIGISTPSGVNAMVVSAMNGNSVSTAGVKLKVFGGDAYQSSGNGNGGDLILSGGLGHGSGTAGKVQFPQLSGHGTGYVAIDGAGNIFWTAGGGGGGGGITNTAANTELMMSDGTNAVPSGIFIPATRTIASASGTGISNDGLSLTLKSGDGYVTSGSGNGGDLTITSGVKRAGGGGNDGAITINSNTGAMTLIGNNLKASVSTIGIYTAGETSFLHPVLSIGVFGITFSKPSTYASSAPLFITGAAGTGSTTAVHGEDVIIQGGSSFALNGNGGSVWIGPGAKAGTGTRGNTYFNNTGLNINPGGGEGVIWFSNAITVPTGGVGSGGGVMFIDPTTHLPIWRASNTNYPMTGSAGVPFTDPLTTNGDIIARISGSTTRLAQGGNGTFLGVSGGVLGYYTPAGGGFTDPLTTDGDIIARVSGSTTRLAKGSNNTFLGINGSGVLGYYTPSGTGTVTTVSVVTANGFAGTVATATSTPAITLTTSVTGIVKGNGTALSAATAGTDYSAGTSALTTGILKSTTTTGALSIAVAADFPTLNQNTTGSAATLTTPRTINGTSFDGSANITVTAAAGTLTGTTLNATVVSSSLSSVGTIGTGTWQGTVVAGQYGGTGVANTGKTITIGGNFATSGAFATTLTVGATTNVTLPASGTLATLAGSETLTNKSVNGVTLVTAGTSTLYLSQDGTYTTPSDASKADVAPTINSQSGTSYTLLLADRAKTLEMTNASANIVTVPLNSSVAFPIGTIIPIAQLGAGLTTVAATGGVTIHPSSGGLAGAGQYTSMFLLKRGTDEWYLFNGSSTGGGGGGGVTIQNVSSSTTLTTAASKIYNVFIDATSGNITVTLPTGDTTTNFIIRRIDSSTNTVTFSGTITGFGVSGTNLTAGSGFIMNYNGSNFYAN